MKNWVRSWLVGCLAIVAAFVWVLLFSVLLIGMIFVWEKLSIFI